LLPFYTLAICMFDMLHDGCMRLLCLRAIKCWVCAYRVLLRRSTTMWIDEVRKKPNILVCGKGTALDRLAAGVYRKRRRRYIWPSTQSRRVKNNTMTSRHPCSMNTITEGKRGHTRQLVIIFCLWKALLLTLAVLCPGPGYDTSALILLEPSLERHQSFSSYFRYDWFALNLFRWDAVYFVKAAERDKTYEQEWAFSWAYSKLLGFIAQCE
jgi:hypothetical protein